MSSSVTAIRPEKIHDEYVKLKEKDLERLFSSSGKCREISCPLCGKSPKESQTWASIEAFHYTSCSGCGLLFMSLRPQDEAIRAYYQSSPSAAFFHEKILFPTSDTRKKTIFQERWELVRSQSTAKSMRVLDVGCSVGTFLEVVEEAGHEAWGIELNETARQLAVKRGRQVVGASSELKGTFDVITAWEVLAHFENLGEVQKIADLLKPGGLFWITTPNAAALEYRLLREKHPNASFPFLQIFSKNNLPDFLKKCGFVIEHLETPGKMDIETIAQTLKNQSFSGPQALQDLLWGTSNENVDFRQKLQKLLSDSLESGHMRLLARKKS